LSVVLFGFAGSPIHQLEKMSNVYTELGFRTLYCILPMKMTFSYDIPNIQKCAEDVLMKAKDENMTDIVCHSLSNNGGILYQHFSQLVTKEEDMAIKGAVFDSSPGPIGIQNIQKVIKVRAINKFHPRGQTSLFLPFHLYGVNMANRVPVGQTLWEVWDQIRFLLKNWAKHKHVPWVGAYMMQQEREKWPLLFIYSKNDKLLPYMYLDELIEVQTKTGRQVVSKRFDKSGPAGHVAHLKYHTEEYKRTVKTFMDSIK